MSSIGTVSILNVGGGDIKISFDRSNPGEAIRAARIVQDMLQRGYALIVEVNRNGEKRYERVYGFDPDTNEYIIADFDPTASGIVAKRIVTVQEEKFVEKDTTKRQDTAATESSEDKQPAKQGGRRGARIKAEQTTAIAVGRSAGG